MDKTIPLIAIVGPTASGKTEVGIRLAQTFDGEVVCVDSRTVYRGMDIGTAKVEGEKGEKWDRVTWDIGRLFEQAPTLVEGISHWGIDLVEPGEDFSVANFVAYAQKKIDDIVSRGKLPILVGGTGLYFRALLDGLTLTDVEPDEALRAELEAKSTEELVEMLGELDPDATANIDINNRRRLVRAIEIVRTTGQSLAEQQKRVETPYNVLWLGMEVDREVLFERINDRVDVMIAKGLIDEARGLCETYGAESQPMTGIGYRQLAAFFASKMPLRDAVERMKSDTRHYAKRQLTWFKTDKRIMWVKSAAEAVAAARLWLADKDIATE